MGVGLCCKMSKRITDKMLEEAFEVIVGAIDREGGPSFIEQLLFSLLRSVCEQFAQEIFIKQS